MPKTKDTMFLIAKAYLKEPDKVSVMAMRKGLDLRCLEARAKLILLNRELRIGERTADHAAAFKRDPERFREAMKKVYGQ